MFIVLCILKKKVISKVFMEVIILNVIVYILNFLLLVFILFKFFYLVNFWRGLERFCILKVDIFNNYVIDYLYYKKCGVGLWVLGENVVVGKNIILCLYR